MTGAIEPFGTLPDGTEVKRVAIAAGDLSAHFISYGAVLQDLRLAGHAAPLVLGFDTLADYLAHSKHFGATAGPCANRTARGHVAFGDKTVTLDLNEGRNHIHGGRKGTGKLNWEVGDTAPDRVTFSLTLPDGHMGYPGPMRLYAHFRIVPPATLEVVYEADCDAPTLVNLAHHSYFNLSGEADILAHELTIPAETYLPVDEEKIPLGDPAPVEGTEFDFRAPRTFGATHGAASRLDHNFCLAETRGAMHPAARVFAPASGVTLEVTTTEPGIQAYDGYQLKVPVPGLDGFTMGPHAGFALEAQIWPDSANHPTYAQARLSPGERLRQTTHYAFSKA